MKKPDTSIISSLLEKHALGICSPEERTLLEQWYAAFPEKGKVWTNPAEKEAIKNSLKTDIFNQIAPAKVIPVQSRNNWWKVAAAVAVLVGLSILYNIYNHKKAPVYVVVAAAAGKGIVQHELPDHSTIWLEPGTTLRYRKDFVNEVRAIELADGMAFFSVTKDAQHPFVVKTPSGVQTKVLGTEFTVKTYTQSKDVQVMVTSGVVQVSDSNHILDTLRPNQQLSYQKREHVSKRTVIARQDWRTGNITLNDGPFEELVRIFKNYYGLQVVNHSKEIAAYRFTIHISKKTTAVDLLEMLKAISGLQYEINKAQVTFH